LKPLTAGSEIDAWCTKCRLDLGHRIIAMVENRPKRVVCQTCGSQHNYRAPKSVDRGVRVRRTTKASSAPRSRTAKAQAEFDRIQEWETKIAGNSLDSFTRYSIDRVFEVDELVAHKKFGEGYVVEILANNKVTVMFKDGPKVLAQGQS
jgi:hypothetical protein